MVLWGDTTTKTPGRKAKEAREEAPKERRFTQQYIRDQFHVRAHPLYGEEKLIADGLYWNCGYKAVGHHGVAITISFDTDGEGMVYAWKAYIGATDDTWQAESAYDWAVVHGNKLHEEEARGILHKYRDVLSRLAYYH